MRGFVSLLVVSLAIVMLIVVMIASPVLLALVEAFSSVWDANQKVVIYLDVLAILASPFLFILGYKAITALQLEFGGLIGGGFQR